jgi:pyruvate/2-oxoglutarate/acetoin dehydrogenase E1 component
MAADERVYLLGEDLLDPYGGAFKVTRGLSTAFPGRVLTTPISEAGITGAAAGMALRGLRPVVEIMFGDFVALIADQLVNHIAKFRWMYNNQVRLPLVIRTPMGGRRGYGPTHSQTLEKLYLGVPGMSVISPNALGDPGELLCRTILETEDPVLFIENKLLYLLPVINPAALSDFELQPLDGENLFGGLPGAFSLKIKGAPPAQLTLAAYGHMAELARQAILDLGYAHEIFAELIVFTRLSPVSIQPLLPSLQQTGRLLTLEEGTLSLGWGAEILARSLETYAPRLKAARRLAARDLPIPASGPLEAAVLPGVPDIVQAARMMV